MFRGWQVWASCTNQNPAEETEPEPPGQEAEKNFEKNSGEKS